MLKIILICYTQKIIILKIRNKSKHFLSEVIYKHFIIYKLT